MTPSWVVKQTTNDNAKSKNLNFFDPAEIYYPLSQNRNMAYWQKGLNFQIHPITVYSRSVEKLSSILISNQGREEHTCNIVRLRAQPQKLVTASRPPLLVPLLHGQSVFEEGSRPMHECVTWLLFVNDTFQLYYFCIHLLSSSCL